MRERARCWLAACAPHISCLRIFRPPLAIGSDRATFTCPSPSRASLHNSVVWGGGYTRKLTNLSERTIGPTVPTYHATYAAGLAAQQISFRSPFGRAAVCPWAPPPGRAGGRRAGRRGSWRRRGDSRSPQWRRPAPGRLRSARGADGRAGSTRRARLVRVMVRVRVRLKSQG